MNFLEGRVALVTGAGRGIGAAVARAFGAEGARVAVNDLGVALDGADENPKPANDVAGEISAAGGEAIAIASDVSDHDAARAMIEQTVDTFGRLDAVVNLAGILRDRMIFNMSEAEWDSVIRVHLKGTFNTCRHAAAYWRSVSRADGERPTNGRLINFISAAGLFGAPGQPNYSAAKAGIVGLTMSCANSLARYGVTANAVAPAAATRMGASVPAEHDRPERQVFRTAEYSPESIAPLAVYLAGADSGWCTGRVLGARGYRVLLYSNPEPIRTIIGREPWKVEDLATVIEQTFRPLPTEYNPFRPSSLAEGGRA